MTSCEHPKTPAATSASPCSPPPHEDHGISLGNSLKSELSTRSFCACDASSAQQGHLTCIRKSSKYEPLTRSSAFVKSARITANMKHSWEYFGFRRNGSCTSVHAALNLRPLDRQHYDARAKQMSAARFPDINVPK